MEPVLPIHYALTITSTFIRYGTTTLVFIFLAATLTKAQSPCSISVTPNVSGCYSVSGASRATVSVEVTWQDAPAGEVITVTYGAQTRTITPGPITVTYTNPTEIVSQTIVSPQVVAFEVDATGAAGQIVTVSFNATTACQAVSQPFTLPQPCPPTSCADGQLGGTVFNDYNADGAQDTGETSGIASVNVSAVACDGTVYTATTDAFGRYTLAVPASQYPVRINFTNLPAYAGNGTPNGTNGHTTVQFVGTPSCTINLGVLSVNDYCETNPKVIVPCYLNGDPSSPNSATDAAIVAVNYDLTGGEAAVATIPQVGAVWGTAYNKVTNSLYSAAFLRRHSGLTANGLGAIFSTNLATNTTSLLVDVASIGVNLGSIGSNASRGLGAKTEPSTDAEAFTKIGRVGMGDLDISEDSQTLYFVNLFTKSLHRLAINNPTYSPSVAIPTPACAGGESRPWGVAIYKGSAYVGVICDGSASGNKSDLRAYIYQYNLTTNTFNSVPVLDFPLTYPKGYAYSAAPTVTGWFPWTDDVTSVFTPVAPPVGNYGDIVIHPEPILADIEFDIDGSMVLSFADRFAFQTGNLNVDPNGNGAYSSIAGGDILRAYFNGNVFILENNAKAGPATGYGPSNSQGPGFGEFYNDDFTVNGQRAHSENAVGGLALKAGSGETVYAAMDPQQVAIANAGGFRKVSNQTGLVTGGFVVYTGFRESAGFFAKAAGIGDPTLTCGQPTYLQIGNRVWRDDNQDGIQDPCEPSIPGAVVTLYDATKTTVIASATTNAAGEYYFANASAAFDSSPSSVTTTGLTYNTGYALVITSLGTSTVVGGLSLSGVSPVTPGESGTLNSGTTAINNDAVLVNGRPCIQLITGGPASVNHTYDFGFICTPPLATVVAGSTTLTVDQSVTLTANVSPAGNYTYAYSGPGTITPTNAATVVVSGLTAGVNTFTVAVTSSAGCFTTATVSVTVVAPVLEVAVTPSLCNSATNSYDLAGTISLTAAVVSTLTVADGANSTTVSILAGQTSASFSLAGLASGTGIRTVTVTGGLGYAPTSVTYAAPASCTPAPVCSISATVTVGLCASATNTFSTTTLVTVLNPAAATLSVIDGSITRTFATTAGASNTFTIINENIVSDGSLHTVTAALPGCGSATTTYTAPASCSVAPILAVAVVPGNCNPVTNQYVISGTISLTAVLTGTLLISDGTSTTTVSVTAGQPTATFALTGLTSNFSSHTVIVSGTGFTPASATYTAPASCLVIPGNPLLSVRKFVNLSRAIVGNVLTYSVVLTNSGSATATATVRDSISAGASYVAGSATTPAGTTFTPGSPLSFWTVPVIAAGQSLTLTFQVRVDSTGILYNIASIPGDTVNVCTTIPIKICPGDAYSLTAPAGRASYQWYRDGVLILGKTTNILVVTEPGSYSLGIGNAGVPCSDFSCCPFILEVDTLPAFAARAVPGTCLGNAPQANGQLIVSNFNPTHTYQYSLGATFNPAASLSGPPQVIPAGGVLVTTLANPAAAQFYTVRVYNRSGCYVDQAVILVPTVCGCPADVCVPYVITQTKRPRRISDPIR